MISSSSSGDSSPNSTSSSLGGVSRRGIVPVQPLPPPPKSVVKSNVVGSIACALSILSLTAHTVSSSASQEFPCQKGCKKPHQSPSWQNREWCQPPHLPQQQTVLVGKDVRFPKLEQ
ncbi:hypothetical protein SUGI_1147700 [Cryptomeria japonica]|nr:hypothetical protein SUGI_1147700 [Cryptomeria japonica]